MTAIDRRTAALLALAAPLAAGAARAGTPGTPPEAPDAGRDMSEVSRQGDERIAMLVYPGMTALDLIGPQFMFGSLAGAKVLLVAKSMDPVTSDTGVTITPTATFDSCPRDLTILFTPGGTDGTLAAASDPATLAFMADRGAAAKYVTSVCTGALVLGAAGLLKGYRATSHWTVRDVLAGFGAIPTDARVVRDRNRVTGAGVTAGLDFGLAMVAELRGRAFAECCQLVGEYDPAPPFNAGSLKTAPTAVRDAMVRLYAGFTEKAKELSERR